VRSAYAAFLPSLSVSASTARQVPSTGARTRIDSNGQIVTLSDRPWSYSARARGERRAVRRRPALFDLRQARGRAQAAAGNEVAPRFAVAARRQQQYFDVLAARESEAAATRPARPGRAPAPGVDARLTPAP